MKKEPIVTLKPDPHGAGVVQPKTILEQAGLRCSLLRLAPGQSMQLEPNADRDHVLFVVEGGVEARVDELNYMLRPDEALHLPKAKHATIEGRGEKPAKLLRMDVFARETDPNLLCSFPG